MTRAFRRCAARRTSARARAGASDRRPGLRDPARRSRRRTARRCRRPAPSARPPVGWEQVFLPRVGGQVDVAVRFWCVLAGQVHRQRARAAAPVRQAQVDAVPRDVGPPVLTRLTSEEIAPAQNGVGAAEGDQRLGEAEEIALPLEQPPVHPADLVVLAVRVVVAPLRAAELVARQQHRRALRQQQQGEEVARLPRAQGEHGRIVGRPFDAAVPADALGQAVAVRRAVGRGRSTRGATTSSARKVEEVGEHGRRDGEAKVW